MIGPRALRTAFIPLLAASAALAAAQPESPLPRYRGFNLLEKFHKENVNGPFREDDFAMISDLGFNFVRLPMDYRVWIRGGDWTAFDEKVLTEIDDAVKWGRKYGVHVCIAFHRAPGYTVASPPEKTSLWTDAETQRVCALHWATFARRYRNIPSADLSFDLFNEPGGIEETAYATIVDLLVKAIRTEDPGRPIFADGLEWGRVPCPSLSALGIGQALHCYDPMEVTHYKASWIEGSDAWSAPRWPSPLVNAYLYGSDKAEYRSPLAIVGSIPPKSTVRIRIGTVSAKSLLRLTADGKTVWEHDFKPGPGAGEWQTSEYNKEWSIYQNYYGRDYTLTLPAGASRLELLNVTGDWATIAEIGITPAGSKTERILRGTDFTWGVRQTQVSFDASSAASPFGTAQMRDRGWLAQALAPWLALKARGDPVMVQEFGFYNRTPHDAGLRWMEDGLSLWKENGLGWALWNFRGEFGILDSGRTDVAYVDYRGHKLDAEMLELLRRY